MTEDQAKCVLRNQIEIMSAITLLLRYAKPDLVGNAGEMDMQRNDLLERHKETVGVLS